MDRKKVEMSKENLKFVSVPFDTIQLLSAGLRRVVGRQTKEVTKLALEHGGFLAGGFARKLARALPELYPYSTEDDENELHWYLNGGGTIDTESTYTKQFGWKQGAGDVDLFFPDKEKLQAFLAAFRAFNGTLAEPLKTKPSNFGNALEILCDGWALVQVVTFKTLPIEETLREFDIMNATATFTKDSFISPEGWRELEEQKMMRVVNWRSPMVFKRMKKWESKHRVQPTQDTVDCMMTEAIRLILAVKDGKHPIVQQNIKDYTERVLMYCNSYRHRLPEESLLLLASMPHGEDYSNVTIGGQCLRELKKRLGEEIEGSDTYD